MKIEFEPSKSFCYRFARYQAIPEILELSEVRSGEVFKIIDFSKQIIDKYLSNSQQSIMLKKAKSSGEDSVAKTIKFYIPFIAKNTGQLISVGNGMFRLPDADDVSEEEINDELMDQNDIEAEEFDGSIYAFTFPALVNKNSPFPIKIGKTTGNVAQRVEKQCKSSATFDNPVILGSWKVTRVGAVESAIHNVLRSRGKWRENVPGVEWFDTTLEEIESIVKFVVTV